MSDYPYQMIAWLGLNKGHDYQLLIGNIIDPIMQKQYGQKPVIYQKAKHDFVVKSGQDIKMTVKQGQVSGPYVLSQNSEFRNLQKERFKNLTNNQMTPDGNYLGQEKFWIDQNSSMLGSFAIPLNGMYLKNTQIDCQNDFPKAKNGLGYNAMPKTYLENVKINDSANTGMMYDSQITDSRLDGKSQLTNTIIDHCLLKDNQIANSQIAKTKLFHNKIVNSQIKPSKYRPLTLEDNELSHVIINQRFLSTELKQKKSTFKIDTALNAFTQQNLQKADELPF